MSDDTTPPRVEPGLLPCPFCGSLKIDPKGWMNSLKETGPECDDCGASCGSIVKWNRRAFIPALAAAPPPASSEVGEMVGRADYYRACAHNGLTEVPPQFLTDFADLLARVEKERDEAHRAYSELMRLREATSARLAEVEKERDIAQEAWADMQELKEKARARAATAEAALEKAKGALRWYADPEVYRPHPHGPAFDNRDLSFHARAALAAMKASDGK